jgi:hypothetical protein
VASSVSRWSRVGISNETSRAHWARARTSPGVGFMLFLTDSEFPYMYRTVFAYGSDRSHRNWCLCRGRYEILLVILVMTLETHVVIAWSCFCPSVFRHPAIRAHHTAGGAKSLARNHARRGNRMLPGAGDDRETCWEWHSNFRQNTPADATVSEHKNMDS